MKIASPILIVVFMSSFLVLGFEIEHATTTQDDHLVHVTTAAGSDIWTEEPGLAADVGADDVSSLVGRAGGALSSDDDDVMDGGGAPAPSERSRESSDGANVIIADSDVTSGVPPAVRTPRRRGAGTPPSKSVINNQSEDTMDEGRLASDVQDTQPSRLSQLSAAERQQLLSNLEASFLKIVGLRARPRPDKQVTIPQYMKELYESHIQSHQAKGKRPVYRGTLHNSNTIRSFFHTEDDDKHPENVVRLKFNITSFPGHEVLQAAELRLYREAIADGSRDQRRAPGEEEWPKQEDKDNNTAETLARQRHRIDVYQILDPGTRLSGALTRLIDTRLVSPVQSGWETFDVTPALESWRTSANHGLEVRFSKASGEPSPLEHVRLKRSTKPLRRHGRSRDPEKDADWEATKPLLVTYSQDSAGKMHQKERRNKRNTDKKRGRRKRSKKNRGKRRKDRPRKDRDYKRDCRRRALYVDFHDVGWTDWIVAPPGYDAFYCYGECPFHMSDHFNTTNHAVVQQFVHSVDPQAVPKPCCVPTELGQLALLYIDEQGKVVLKNYDEMVVEACGCR